MAEREDEESRQLRRRTEHRVAINNRGQITGWLYGPQRAFLWQNGKFTDLGTLGGASLAYAINDRGQIVGDSSTGEDDDHAFLWEKGTMTDLGNVATDGLTWINNRGQVAASTE